MNLYQKHHTLKKDIDKIISGQYVLVPITATEEMLQKANQVFYSMNYGTDVHTIIKYIWNTMIEQAVNEQWSKNEM